MCYIFIKYDPFTEMLHCSIRTSLVTIGWSGAIFTHQTRAIVVTTSAVVRAR
jgi:hypothetical protein